MKRGVWTSDNHIGLLTDEINRTEEIIDVMIFIAKHAVKIKADFFVFGGDIFNTNAPTEHHIAQFIRVLNILLKAGIKTYVMAGNHDTVSSKTRRSCLSFIRKIKKGYPNVELVDDVKTIKFGALEVGDCYFTFLPHLTKAHISEEYKSPQQYVDFKMKTLAKKLDWTCSHYVFSHLNVLGAHPGSEDSLLKKVDLHVPEVLTKWKPGKSQPTIIQGHIHTKQEIGNINIVGSPIFVNFGEKERHKFFLQIDIPEFMGEGKGGLTYIETPCRPFIQWDVDVKPNQPVSLLESKKFKKMGEELTPDAVLKLNVVVHEEDNKFDWEAVRKSFQKHCFYVKPIKPKVLRQRIKRNKKQVVTLQPKEAVKLWLKNNKTKDADRILKLADTYIEGAT